MGSDAHNKILADSIDDQEAERRLCRHQKGDDPYGMPFGRLAPITERLLARPGSRYNLRDVLESATDRGYLDGKPRG
jgi:hypothetical protein